MDGRNFYAWSLNDRLVVHSSSAPLVKRSYRLLGGMAGHEGLVALVGLHLAGRQFKGHGELGSRKRYIRKGASALLGAGTRTQGVLSHTVHVPCFVLPLSKPFGGKSQQCGDGSGMNPSTLSHQILSVHSSTNPLL